VKSPNNNFSCNCSNIKSVDSIKYLGVTFDKYLKWDTHIGITVKKIRSLFYKFKSLKNILLQITTRMVFCALDQSIFSYVISAWGGAYITHLKKLTSTINSLLRISFKLPFRTNIDIIYDKTYNLLNLKQLYIKEVLCNLYLYNHKEFNFKHNYDTFQIVNNTFQMFKCNSEFGKRNLYYISLYYCNYLCINITSFDNFTIYKKYVIYKVTISQFE